MAKNSPIEWTHHTFNPWWGCTKVSPACKHCYADFFARRIGHGGKKLPVIWGTNASRKLFGDAHWAEPLRWNREAMKTSTRARVFCASMADVFEVREDLVEPRKRLFRLIEQTPHLDWLLLTKRPETAASLATACGWLGAWPTNVWAGATVENQRYANERVPALSTIPAAVRFLSCEPLLGPLDLSKWVGNSIDWVIVGGESGGHARPMKPDWARAVRDQCIGAGSSFLFKQWGNWSPKNDQLVRSSKKKAGRKLDGRTWDEVPVPGAVASVDAAE